MHSKHEADTAPALWTHTRSVYNKMLEEAKRVTVESVDMVVWEGRLTHLVTTQCNLSVPYYTKIREVLLALGCIRQLRRGGGSSPSQWELLHDPSYEEFMKLPNIQPSNARNRTRASSAAIEQALKAQTDVNNEFTRRLNLIYDVLNIPPNATSSKEVTS